jgi:dTDP-4-dehydrorhamnose reductase
MFLIVGADSEVGRALVGASGADGTPVIGTTRRDEGTFPGRLRLDLDDIPLGWAPPEGVRAACIAAAVARLAECEADPAGSAHINCTQTIEFTRRLAELGIYTLFLSTNQVFDGATPRVAPDAPMRPVSVYGRQKALTEAALRQMMSDGAPVGILRLSKVVSPGMKLFTDWRDSLAAGRPVRAFEDMALSPVPVDLVVQAIIAMMRTRATLVAQLTGPRDVSYLDAGRHVANLAGADQRLVQAGRASEISLPPGATPVHTTLDSSFLHDAHGMVVPDAMDVVTGALGP